MNKLLSESDLIDYFIAGSKEKENWTELLGYSFLENYCKNGLPDPPNPKTIAKS